MQNAAGSNTDRREQGGIMSKTLSMDTIEVERAPRDLRSAAYVDRDVEMTTNNAQRFDNEPVTESLVGMSASAKGAIAGAILGGVAGLAASMSGVDLPGVAPILAYGSVVATFAGAGVGAIAGGVIGGLAELGVDRAPLSDGASSRRATCGATSLSIGGSRISQAHERDAAPRAPGMSAEGASRERGGPLHDVRAEYDDARRDGADSLHVCGKKLLGEAGRDRARDFLANAFVERVSLELGWRQSADVALDHLARPGILDDDLLRHVDSPKINLFSISTVL
jgi:hypothetical protein